VNKQECKANLPTKKKLPVEAYTNKDNICAQATEDVALIACYYYYVHMWRIHAEGIARK
jgi:hypothetical protein